MPPKWEDEFGKSPDEMNEEEYRMAVLSTLYQMKKDFRELDKRTQCIPRHDRLIWAGCVLVPTLFGLFAWLAERLLK